jgi:hypothetical protein
VEGLVRDNAHASLWSRPQVLAETVHEILMYTIRDPRSPPSPIYSGKDEVLPYLDANRNRDETDLPVTRSPTVSVFE